MNEEVEEFWQEEWKDVVCDESGNINMEQLKKVLYNYSSMMDEVSKVYCEITKNLLSYPHYSAETVLEIFRNEYANKVYAIEYLPDDWDIITDDCETNEDYKKALFEYFEIDDKEGGLKQ